MKAWTEEVGEIDGKNIKDSQGKKVLEFDGKNVKDEYRQEDSDNWRRLRKIVEGEAGISLIAMWYFFVWK